MSQIEEELRAAFARHEAETPATAPVRAKIDFAWVRVKKRRTTLRAFGAATAVLLSAGAVPAVLAHRSSGSSPAQVNAESVLTASTASAAPAGPTDVLVLGVADQRARTILLIHLAADHRRAYFVDLPVRGVAGDRLTESYRTGGVAAARAAAAQLTGVGVDATMTFELSTLTAVTRQFGTLHACDGSGACADLPAETVARLLREPDDLDRRVEGQLRDLVVQAKSNGVLTDPKRFSELVRVTAQGVRMEGDIRWLTGSVDALSKAEVVVVAPSRANAVLDTASADALYRAVRADSMTDWVAAHPAYVMQGY